MNTIRIVGPDSIIHILCSNSLNATRKLVNKYKMILKNFKQNIKNY